jgi:hypothetical protein
MLSQRIRSYVIVTTPPIHKIARENYTRSKRNLFGHINRSLAAIKHFETRFAAQPPAQNSFRQE